MHPFGRARCQNLSMRDCQVHAQEAVLTADNLIHYCPVSNLSVVSRITEEVVDKAASGVRLRCGMEIALELISCGWTKLKCLC